MSWRRGFKTRSSAETFFPALRDKQSGKLQKTSEFFFSSLHRDLQLSKVHKKCTNTLLTPGCVCRGRPGELVDNGAEEERHWETRRPASSEEVASGCVASGSPSLTRWRSGGSGGRRWRLSNFVISKLCSAISFHHHFIHSSTSSCPSSFWTVNLHRSLLHLHFLLLHQPSLFPPFLLLHLKYAH